ncbi:MAG: 3-phosphoserine/phosphohydroxythreonine transaminase [Abitibacteriaceae bacterium]|nr:3-phosphoserine/phosphohydroxythreonine transaminase [Abditibacteriaceae bacterium]
MKRVFNFSAGPAALPVPVLEQVQAEMLDWHGTGMSVLEMSHRSKAFTEIIERAEADVRELLGVPENYHVLFLQGGASLQFSMVPLNLLGPGEKADYILNGIWSQKALKEASKVGTANVAGTTESENFRRVPRADELTLDAAAQYVHITTNETIYGVEWQSLPDVGTVPLVADASSDILSRPLDVAKFGLIYAGAQKNMGPSGVTLVILRDDILRPTPDNLSAMLNYKTHVKTKSLYNTPNTFGIYVIGLVAQWLKSLGGLAAMQKINEQKAALLYGVIDSGDFYRGHATPDSRSLMNVTFRLPSDELEKQFVQEATAQGLVELKGHRDVGGIRASLYNAFPLEGVETLAHFMREFQQRNG